MSQNKKEINTIKLLHAIREIPFNIITAIEKHILNTILSCINIDNDTWRGMDVIAHFSCLSVRSINRHIKSIEKKKFIFVKRPEFYTHKKTNHYSLNIELIMSFSVDKSGVRLAPDNDIGCQPVTQYNQVGCQVVQSRVTGWHTEKKREEKKEEKDSAREKRAPLSASFFANEKSTALIQEMGYTENEAQIIATDFMDHYLDSGILSNQWQRKLIKWFRNDRREPGFLNDNGGNGNGHIYVNNKSLEIDPVGQTYVRTPEDEKAGKEALAKIMGNLKGVNPNGLLDKIRTNGENS